LANLKITAGSGFVFAFGLVREGYLTS